MSAIAQSPTEQVRGIELPAGNGREARDSFLDWPIALMAAAWFFNLPNYLGMFVIAAVNPLTFGAVTLAVLVGRQLLCQDYLQRIHLSLPIWVLGLALLDLWWFAMFGGGDTAIVGPRILFLSLILTFYLVFAAVPRIAWLTMRLLLTGTWIIVPVLAYNLLHPFAFVPAENEFAVVGRAGAIFVNPNLAASALCAALFLGYWNLTGAWRWLFLAWVSCGILMTGSRGALLGVPFVFGVMTFLGRFPARRLLAFFVVLAGMVGVAYLVLPLVADYVGIQSTFVIDRFAAFLGADQVVDFSSEERRYLLDKGMELYSSSPLVGSGVGSTELWDERTSTHNMFVQLLSDFGVSGGLVLPVLLWMGLVDRGSRALSAVTVFYVLWGLFSHNLASTETSLMVALALAFSLSADQVLAGKVQGLRSAPTPVQG